MQLNVFPTTWAALKADGTIRCLADVRYQPVPESRHSSTAFALARTLADEFTIALVAQLGQPEAPATHGEPSSSPAYPDPNTSKTGPASAQAQLYAVQLRRNRMRVCFDVFLDDDRCTPEFRREIDETVARPIHAVTKLGDGDGYQVERKPSLDAKVVGEIAYVQDSDKGPRPYFTDGSSTMFYDDGIRVEDNLEQYGFLLPPSGSRRRRWGDS